MNPVHVIVDLEVTGFDYKHDQILQIGALALGPKPIGDFELLVKPHRVYEDRQLNLKGKTIWDLENAEPQEEVASVFRRWLMRMGMNRGIILHAYNQKHEQKFLVQEPWGIPAWVWGEDIMLLAFQIMKQARPPVLQKSYTRWKYPRLIPEAAPFFKVTPHKPTHTALADCRTTADIWEKILAWTDLS